MKGCTVRKEMHFPNAERHTKQRKMCSLKRTLVSSELAKFDTVISTRSAGYNVISDHTILSLREIRTQAITCRPQGTFSDTLKCDFRQKDKKRHGKVSPPCQVEECAEASSSLLGGHKVIKINATGSVYSRLHHEINETFWAHMQLVCFQSAPGSGFA